LTRVFVRQLGLALLGGFLSVAAAQKSRVPGKVDPDRYDETFRKYSKRYFGIGYDWRVFKAQALAESGMDTAAVSFVGARGLMQLMPSTYGQIQSRATQLKSIDDPEWNIAAGIMHDRGLYLRWKEPRNERERRYFMFGSYNAGEGPIIRAQRTALERALDAHAWQSIESVAPDIPRWRYRETLGYVRKIRLNMDAMDGRGRVAKKGIRKR
jgi:soluble lytic murein transglycosylase-like protein